ncbi:273b3885-6612-426d-b74f-c745aea1cba3 [Thermothielavioides terrestris]|uniref:273b3885-6612-426d-b74f-c745aea1cba3 n=1 Tax=Thermothielavioides terrestris TaxID=2587410 RepID=A0A3S4ATL2_9PEZI|nr:273b3885-6612-426d-b74f-c745aea1cba3 [Thermothielavioides terrestris]
MRKLGKSSGTHQTAPALYTSKFEQLVDFSKVPSYTKSSAINRVVLRDLLMEPVKAAKRVQYRREFSRYEIIRVDEGAEKVKVHFKDGSSDICDVLIGADGSRSRINHQLGLDNLVPLKSHWSFLSKGKLPRERMLELPEHLQKGPIIVFSKGISLYYALYLPEDFRNQNASKDGTKVISYDEEGASFYWGLNAPVEMVPFQKPEEIRDRRQLCLDLIKHWAPEFHRMLRVGENDAEAPGVHVTMLSASTQPSLGWPAKEEIKRCLTAPTSFHNCCGSIR